MSESSFEEEPPKPGVTTQSIAGSSNPGFAGYGSTSNSDDKIVAKADDQAVKLSKLAVLLVIGITAIAFASVTYVFTFNEETSDFELQ